MLRRLTVAVALLAIVSSQAVLMIVLVSLAPLTVFWYASSADYRAAILFNAVMFGVASVGPRRCCVGRIVP